MAKLDLNDYVDELLEEQLGELFLDLKMGGGHWATLDTDCKDDLLIFPASDKFDLDFMNGKISDVLTLKINFYDTISNIVNEFTDENICDNQHEVVDKLKSFFQKQIEKLDTYKGE